MPRPQDLISRGLLGQAAVTLASKGFIAGIFVAGEIVIPDGVKWNEAQCYWDTTSMAWDYARTHACIAIEEALTGRTSGGMGEFMLYVPFEHERKDKKKRYIKLTCRVDDVKYTEKKEVRTNIKVTPKDVDMLIKEALIKLEVITDKQDKELV
jgi:hypothetical protein